MRVCTEQTKNLLLLSSPPNTNFASPTQRGNVLFPPSSFLPCLHCPVKTDERANDGGGGGLRRGRTDGRKGVEREKNLIEFAEARKKAFSSFLLPLSSPPRRGRTEGLGGKEGQIARQIRFSYARFSLSLSLSPFLPLDYFRVQLPLNRLKRGAAAPIGRSSRSAHYEPLPERRPPAF